MGGHVSASDFGHESPGRTGPRVLIIVPALNEQDVVGDVVREIARALPDAVALVIDDGSRDETAAVARAAGARVVRMPFNTGIGTAVQTGFKVAFEEGFDIAVQVDGDVVKCEAIAFMTWPVFVMSPTSVGISGSSKGLRSKFRIW